MKNISERQSDLQQIISTRLPTKTRRKVGVSALPAGRRLDPKGLHRRRRTYAISTVLAALVSLSAFPAGLAEAQQTMGGNGGNSGAQTSGGVPAVSVAF